MEKNFTEEKSRKEKRKEARLAKKKDKYSSWVQHKKSLKEKTKKSKLHSMAVGNPKVDRSFISSQEKILCEIDKELSKKPKKEPDSVVTTALLHKKKSRVMRKLKKTKFEEYIEMERKRGVASAEEDLEMERKLAKKLKLKCGKLRNVDDGLNILFDGIPSVLDSVNNQVEVADAKVDIRGKSTPLQLSSIKKHKKRKLSALSENEEVEVDMTLSDGAVEGSGMVTGEVEVRVENPIDEVNKSNVSANYVPPHLRSRGLSESEECTQIRRRVRGLLNRLSETNVESITGEVSSIIQTVSRREGFQIICDEVLASCTNGPRGNEQYAAVFASFVAGMACLLGIDFSAKFIASLAKSFEDEYSKCDSPSTRNLTLLLSYLCIFGVSSSDLIYDFLSVLSKRLTELDVSTILTILQCCGMKLRGDDPTAMKDFILQVHSRVNELKLVSERIPNGQPKVNSKRMEFMLETICDIKNNKKRQKEDTASHTRVKKWLQKLHIEDALLRGLKWSLLLDPDKKGQWWLTGNTTCTTDDVEEVASTIDREVLEVQQLLELAASQRMNTDARRAIFCVIMSSEDYIDAFEKILRLDLPGKQDREVMRVLVECCLQEKVFNKYYTVLASKLCGHDKNHKFTLQYCLWDHYKELESMELNRSMNLAKFAAEMFASFSLSLAILKVVDLSNPKQLTPKRIMHFRMLFEFIFEKGDALVWNIFTRIAAAPEYEPLRSNLEFFIKQFVANTGASAPAKFKIAKKALANLTGVLM